MNFTPRPLRKAGPPPRPIVIVSVKPLADVWLVREADSSAGEVYDRKDDALARAEHLLRRLGGGLLRVLRRDGMIDREFEMVAMSRHRTHG
jgi:hypothetical protein